ncbi:MAG TPA: serine hydrolase domain-containing protein [Thermoanaerobaculia bacterium]
MKRLLIIALLFVGCAHQRINGFVQRADAKRAELGIPGMSMAIVRDGHVVLARGFGYADVEAKTPATKDTLYPIGSITKTFTSTLMLQLAEGGKLDLEKDVAQYVDWEVAPDIRIRHVLSHTSEFTPGTRYKYSSRFNWLDNVVEAATKESFRTLMDARVLKPAGLNRTLMGTEDEGYAESLPDLAKPYDKGARSKYPPMAFHSSSGLSSTVVELARYSVALDEGRLLSNAARERAWTPSFNGAPYGLGWFTQNVGGERVVWHTSWWPNAYSGLLVKVPSRGLTLVLLANSDALVSSIQGGSNALLYPIASDFLRTFLGCCDVEHANVSDEDRLRAFKDVDAGRRLVAKYPDDLEMRFNVALAIGNVRPSLRINGDGGDEALAMLRTILDSGKTLPKWMDAWTSYLIAERTGDRALAERAMKTGVDTDGLQARVKELLAR